MTHESKMGQSGHSVVPVDEFNAKLAAEKIHTEHPARNRQHTFKRWLIRS